MAVTFGALGTAGANQNGFTTSLNATGSHTATSGDPIILGYTSRNGGQSRASQTTRTVTLGGVAMTLLGFIEFSANEAFCELWSGVGNGSAQATSVTVGNATNAGREIVLNSVSYSGVGSIGTVTTNSGGGTAATMSSVVSATNEMVAAMFGASQGALSAFTPNSRHADNTGDNFANMIIGDAAGAATVNFAATTVAGPWGGIAVRLAPPATQSARFFAMF